MAARAIAPRDSVTERSVRQAAESGDACAQLKLGNMYRGGSAGVPADRRAAARWYRLAADQGNADAQFRLANMYLTGAVGAVDMVKGHAWLSLAAEQGLEIAETRLESVERSMTLTELSERQVALGTAFRLGDGVPSSDREAVAWYRLAAAEGASNAQVELARMYSAGRGVAPEKGAAYALAWSSLASAQGRGDARRLGRGLLDRLSAVQRAEVRHRVGIMLRDGEEVPPDEAAAANWFLRAARHGLTAAVIDLGLMHFEGRGVARDESRAYAWFSLAFDGIRRTEFTEDDIVAKRVSPDEVTRAQMAVAAMCRSGALVGKSKRDAAAWYERAAKRGAPEAQLELATMYLEGDGVPRDDARAFAWSTVSAGQGDGAAEQVRARALQRLGPGRVPRAHLRLADCYRDVGDFGTAARWYRRAAQGGVAAAQAELGALCSAGRGVSRDEAQACAWFHLAAEQGDKRSLERRSAVLRRMAADEVARAQRLIGDKYRHGEGIGVDRLKAYAWYFLAADGGDIAAKESKYEAGSVLIPEEIAHAERLASELGRQETLDE